MILLALGDPHECRVHHFVLRKEVFMNRTIWLAAGALALSSFANTSIASDHLFTATGAAVVVRGAMPDTRASAEIRSA